MKRHYSIFLIPFLLLSLSAQAQPDPFNGYYIGVAAGGSFTNGTESLSARERITMTSDTSTFDADFPFSSEHFVIDNAVKGAVYVGFGDVRKRWYLGVEIFGDVSEYKATNIEKIDVTVPGVFGPARIGIPIFVEGAAPQQAPSQTGAFQDITITSRTKISPAQFGIDLRPGFKLTEESLFYARVGIALAKVHVNSVVDSTFILNNINGSSTPIFDNLSIPLSEMILNANKQVLALRLSLGLERFISSVYSVRLDYIYTYYGKVNASTTMVQNPNDPTNEVILNSSSNIKVRSNAVLLGFSYHF